MKRLLTVLLLIAFPSVCVSIPVEWTTEDGGNGHYYEAIADYGVNWFNAKNVAILLVHEGMLGHLVTISSAEENEWVWATLREPGGYWLGGFQQDGSTEPDQGWAWVIGEEWVYSNWIPTEPNEAHDNENSMLFEPGYAGQWNDRVDYQYNIEGYIVEYESAVIDAGSSSWSEVKSLFR